MRIIVLVMVLGLAACSPGGHSAPRTTPTPATADVSPSPERNPGVPEGNPGAHTVTFAIRGTVPRTSVTYTTPDGRKRSDVVSPPWRRTFTVGDGQSVDMTAHSTGGGTLGCTLMVDGELVKSATSSGDSATVDCGDSIGF